MTALIPITFLASLTWPGDVNKGQLRPPRPTFSGQQVDYIAWYNDFVRQGRSENSNAFPLYEAICADADGKRRFLHLPYAVGEEWRRLPENPRVWSADESPEMAAYVVQCKPYFDIMRKALKREAFWIPAPLELDLLQRMKVPIISGARDCSEQMLCAAWMKCDNQLARLKECWETLFGVAMHLDQDSFSSPRTTACKMRERIHHQILVAIAAGIVDGRNAASLYKDLLGRDPTFNSYENIVTVQWAIDLQSLQHMCRQPYFDGEHIEVTGGSSPRKKAKRPFRPAQIEAELDEYHTKLLKAVASSPSRAQLGQIQEICHPVKDEAPSGSWMFMWKNKNFPVPYAYMLIGESKRRGTYLTLALHAYHAKFGAWPETLDILVKKLDLPRLAEMTSDPVADRPYVYMLREGQPQLYSMGMDGHDHGGTHDLKYGKEPRHVGDYVFWPPTDPINHRARTSGN